MNKNHRVARGKYKIGFTRKVRPMQPKAIAHCMREPPHGPLRLRVRTSDLPHDVTAAPFTDDVHPVISTEYG